MSNDIILENDCMLRSSHNEPLKTTNKIVNPFETLPAKVKMDLDAVNQLIYKHMDSQVSMIPKLGEYIISAGGKRIRPVLTLVAAHLCDYKGTLHIDLATSVEFIHTATLLHDDVVDNSETRRGKSAAHTVFGTKYSILVGDFLFSRAFELMVETQSLPVLKVLYRASSVIAEGEVLQLQTANNLTTTERDYFNVIKAKTAALFSASCEIAPILAQVSEDKRQALYDYGDAIGQAFQLTDDILDYTADPSYGKVLGDDFREGKVTLPVIHAYMNATTQEEKSFWHRTMVKLEQFEGDFDQALAYMMKYQSIEYTTAIAIEKAEAAIDALSLFEDSTYKTFLIDLAIYVRARV